ncbi:MAG: alpha/beta hydrolase, partial [Gammaproteobacteria bacterium]|nr:alpha/beta hydrolase [Gammaproteobacteria bacterium]
MMPLLADRRRVIAIDMPGFGMSDPVPDPQTIERYAEVIGKALRD